MVQVSAYTRGDGTAVRAHTRSAPGSGRQLALLALAAVVVLGIGGAQTSGHTSGHKKPSPVDGRQGETPTIRVVFPTGSPAGKKESGR